MNAALLRRLILPLLVVPLMGAKGPEVVVLSDGPPAIGGAAASALYAGQTLPVVARRGNEVEVAAPNGRLRLSALTVADLSETTADAVLFAQAREHARHQRHAPAIALYHVLSHRLPRSPYAPEALLNVGQEADALARAGGSAAVGRWWGVRLEPVGDGRWRYDGAAYAEFLSRYPRHPLGEEALYSQIRTEMDWAGPWTKPDGPLAERRRWEFFLAKYPRSAHKPAAWLRWCYLSVAAAELAVPARPEQASAYRRQAEDKLREVVSRFRGTEWSARARRALGYLGHGGRVYAGAQTWPYESRF